MLHRQEYLAFQNAKYRCTNPENKAYPDYGGRGIKFCFSSFAEFLAEVGPRPSAKHSLDRFPNNDGNYEKGNVRWATAVEQANNCRPHKPRVDSVRVAQNVQITIPPHAVSIEKAAEIVGVLPWTINEAIAVGKLPAKTAGRARTVRVADLIHWYDSLPDAAPRPSLLARHKNKVAA